MYDLTIPRRIRQRREERGLAGYELAKQAGISPSYLSLIESGQKLPSEEVAVRLAEALGDEPDLYRAWVETGDEDERDLEARQQRLNLIRRVRSPGQFELTQERPSRLHRRGRSRMKSGRSEDAQRAMDLMPMEVGDAVDEDVAFRREQQKFVARERASVEIEADEEVAHLAAFVSEPPMQQVPLLAEGTDPAEGLPEAEWDETVLVDRRQVPEEAHVLFAYRVTERSIDRIRGFVRPEDLLVFAANPEGVDPLAIYAVRYRGRIVLSRITYSAPLLLLPSSDPYEEPLTLEVDSEERLFDALAGVVVAGIRRWPMPPPMERAQRPSLGRTGRLDDDGNIVRDCEWKENYGWRPVQRPEDMDYLDDHPGTTVQFRLLRDGELEYVLEMDPDEWREALGSYYASSSWRRNGYIVAITKRVKGEYGEEFQDRWAGYVRRPRRGES